MRVRREGALTLVVLGALLLVALAVAAGGGLGSTAAAPSPTRAGAERLDPVSGLPTIQRAALPPEARTTLDRIAGGGPFEHGEDGSVFQNRERLLPERPPGSYHEYTVETPGSADRGARRIVTGGPGEAYWTTDHYASFARIVP
jgi:ribonuclease T1